jgi:hypothetical protein
MAHPFLYRVSRENAASQAGTCSIYTGSDSRMSSRARIEPWVKVATVAVAVSTIIELPIELIGASTVELLAQVTAQILVLSLAIATYFDLRFCRYVFCFLCGWSALAIAPTLASLMVRYPVAGWLSIIECIVKTGFVAVSVLASPANSERR